MSQLDPNSTYVLKTGSTDFSQKFEKLPLGAGMIGTDENGNPIDKSAEMYKVKTNAEDTVPAYLTDKLADTLDIEFNPIEDPENPGSVQLESTIYQLTGKGAALAVRDIPGLAHPEGPGITGFHYGRSCTPGYGYKLNPLSGVKTKSHMWVAQSSNGTLFRSYDNFKSATQDLSLVNYDNTHVAKISTSPYGAQCLAYITLPSGDNAWVNFIGSQKGYYVLNDIPANYNDDGSIVSANWVWVDVPGIPQWIGHATRITSGGIFATSSFTAGIYYTPDLVTWTKVESRGGVNEVAGISSDSYGTYLAVERNSGILIRNNSELTGTFDPTAWNDITSADGFTVTTPDGITVSAEHLPVTSGSLGTWWAGLGCAYGLWVCTVARKEATSDPVYAYSDNGINWITYGGTEEDQLITVWDMGSDGAFWFGCPVGTSTPLVYQLLVNSIPARKRFVAEKGIMIVGDTFLQDYPDAEVLGTDENGKIVPKAGGGYTLPIASATVLGGIKVGTNLTIDPDGTLNAEASGVQGPQGYQGNDGSQGPAGADGPQGPQGNDGAQGSSGSQGAQGSVGVQGSAGVQGPQGAQGATGAQGSTGVQGPQGYQGVAGESATGKYMPTMDPAVGINTMIPSLTGTRSEICVIATPRVDVSVTASSIFACAITQGGTGTIIMTLRDSNYNKIASSTAITNPSGGALLTAGVNELEDPITHNSISEYILETGKVYFLGINYSINGAAYLGVNASQNTNFAPYAAKKFDNLSDAPDTLSGGSETLIRPFVRISG